MKRSLTSAAQRTLAAPYQLLRNRPTRSKAGPCTHFLFRRPQWPSVTSISSSGFVSQFRSLSDSAAEAGTTNITGTVTRSIRFEGQYGFKVGSLEINGSEEEVKIVGNMPGLKVEQKVIVTGDYELHSVHGKQFEEVVSHELDGGLPARVIEDIVPGIGSTLAKTIVDFADRSPPQQ